MDLITARVTDMEEENTGARLGEEMRVHGRSTLGFRLKWLEHKFGFPAAGGHLIQ